MWRKPCEPAAAEARSKSAISLSEFGLQEPAVAEITPFIDQRIEETPKWVA
jgi:hypothetical protein